MSGHSSVAECGLISTGGIEGAIYHALQMLVGRGRKWSCEDLAFTLTEAGHPVSKHAVQSWIAGNDLDRKCPPTDVLLKLFQLLGKTFATKVLSAIGMGAYDLTPALAQPSSVVATLAMVTHRFADAAEDHVFTNPELGELEPVADAGIAVLEPFSSRRKG